MLSSGVFGRLLKEKPFRASLLSNPPYLVKNTEFFVFFYPILFPNVFKEKNMKRKTLKFERYASWTLSLWTPLQNPIIEMIHPP